MTHHSVMTSSLLIKNFEIDKFRDFSNDIDFKSKMDIFCEDISLIINQCYQAKRACGYEEVISAYICYGPEYKWFLKFSPAKVLHSQTFGWSKLLS